MLLSTSTACSAPLPGAQGVFLHCDCSCTYSFVSGSSIHFLAAWRVLCSSELFSSVSALFLAHCIGTSFHGGLRLHPTFYGCSIWISSAIVHGVFAPLLVLNSSSMVLNSIFKTVNSLVIKSTTQTYIKFLFSCRFVYRMRVCAHMCVNVLACGYMHVCAYEDQMVRLGLFYHCLLHSLRRNLCFEPDTHWCRKPNEPICPGDPLSLPSKC